MARIRSVHPGLWTDEAFVSVSPIGRLLAIGLWNQADDAGIFEWKPITLKMRLFPADSVDISALLAELADANIIRAYEMSGKKLGAIRNFGKYQRPKKPNYVHPMEDQIRTYVAFKQMDGKADDDEWIAGSEGSDANKTIASERRQLHAVANSEPVPHQSPTTSPSVINRFPTDGEISPQR
jgi:hypothetical protein